MHPQRVCTKCQSRAFYVLQPARMPDGHTGSGTMNLAIAAEFVSLGKPTMFSDPHEMIAAEVDAWVCAHCGFTEFYARDLRVLAHLVSRGSPHVRYVG